MKHITAVQTQPMMYTWGDSDVILFITVITTMLEVYTMLQQYNVVNLSVIANCCVEWHQSR